MRRLLLAAVLLTALAVASTSLGHPPADPYPHDTAHYDGLPDLAADPADGIKLAAYDIGDRKQLLLRFNGYIYNKPGPIANADAADANDMDPTNGVLELRGTSRQGSEMGTVTQRVYAPDGTTWQDLPSSARLVYETNDTHSHWHLFNAAKYSLVAGGSLVAPSAKVGFCLIDSEHDFELGRGPYLRPQWSFNSHGNCGDQESDVPQSVKGPDAANVVMGLSPGWRDTYGANLAFQWIDVSNTLPGTYTLRAKVDPLDYVQEVDENNPPADVPEVTLPGYLARPVSATGLSRTATSTIALDADDVPSTIVQGHENGSPQQLAAPQFRIDRPPANGRLDVPTGAWFTATEVKYTPNPFSDGADSFTYSVREGTSQFPISPSQAQVSVALAGPSPAPEQVTISGGSDMLFTSTSAQLTGTVTNPRGSGTLTWKVNGIPGGDTRVGTVSQTGLYQAPTAVPAEGTVTVSATSDRGVTGEKAIRIAAPPAREPAPGIDVPTMNPTDPPAGNPGPTVDPTPDAPKPALGGIRAMRKGRFVIVSFVPGRSGRVKTTLYTGKRRLRSCSSRVGAGRAYTCRLTAPRRAKRLKVRIVFRRLDGRVLVRRTVTVKRAARAAHRH